MLDILLYFFKAIIIIYEEYENRNRAIKQVILKDIKEKFNFAANVITRIA